MCMRTAHVLAGAYAGAGVAWAQGQPWWVLAASASLGALTAPGPDVDQHKWWRRLDKWVPDEWLGKGGPLQHRGITHFWGIPMVAALALIAFAPNLWFAWAALAGWVSHLLLDWIWGKRAWGRGPGIPIGPWFWHVGLGGDAGGWLERRILVPVLAVAGPGILAWPLLGPLVRTATTAWEATR